MTQADHPNSGPHAEVALVTEERADGRGKKAPCCHLGLLAEGIQNHRKKLPPPERWVPPDPLSVTVMQCPCAVCLSGYLLHE